MSDQSLNKGRTKSTMVRQIIKPEIDTPWLKVQYYDFIVQVDNLKYTYITKKPFTNKTLGRARDPRANGAWLNKLTE